MLLFSELLETLDLSPRRPCCLCCKGEEERSCWALLVGVRPCLQERRTISGRVRRKTLALGRLLAKGRTMSCAGVGPHADTIHQDKGSWCTRGMWESDHGWSDGCRSDRGSTVSRCSGFLWWPSDHASAMVQCIVRRLRYGPIRWPVGWFLEPAVTP